ncbi:MAG: DUF6345 domain-containing protein [bacterium]
MRKRCKTLLIMGIFLSLFFLFTGTSLLHAAQARCHAVDWDSQNATCQSTNGNFEKACSYWIGEMEDHWSVTTKSSNTFGIELCDSEFESSCCDNTGDNLDNGDATLLATHGGTEYGDRFEAQMSSPNWNPGGDDCRSNSNYWMLGDNDAEFVALFACHSLQKQYVNGWGTVPNHWRAHTRRLHQLQGFQGSLSTGQKDELDDFADDAFDGAVSWAWIENMTIWGANTGKPYDRCGINLIFGYNKVDAHIRRDFERYHPTQFPDPPSTGDWTTQHFYCNCDAPAAPTLICGQ